MPGSEALADVTAAPVDAHTPVASGETAHAAPAPAMPRDRPPADPFFRISLELYHRMTELGLIGPRDRIELLDGIMVRKMSEGPRHSSSAQALLNHFLRVLPAGYTARKGDPISLPGGDSAPDSEPEPDVSVVRGVVVDFLKRHPGPAEVVLVVEVADSSLREGRAGLARYARAGIPEAWIVNLVDEVVERYTEPTGPSSEPRYLRLEILRRGDRLDLAAGGAVLAAGIEVAAFLPPAAEP